MRIVSKAMMKKIKEKIIFLGSLMVSIKILTFKLPVLTPTLTQLEIRLVVGVTEALVFSIKSIEISFYRTCSRFNQEIHQEQDDENKYFRKVRIVLRIIQQLKIQRKIVKRL